MTTLTIRPEASATITVPVPIVVVPGYDETVYTWGFESYATTPSTQVYFQNFETNTLDGWALTGGGKLVNSLWGGAPLSQGQRSLTVGGNSVTTTPNFGRTFPGLTVGRSYTVSAIGCALAPSPTVTTGTIGVDGIGNSGNVNLTNTANITAAYSFVATATSHVVRITTTNGGAGDMATWDNITLTANTYVTNNGLDGFSSGTVGTTRKRTGSFGALMNGAAKAFTGLVIGHQYTLRGWRWNTTALAWERVGATYTAASTGQAFSLPSGSYYWDDMELVHHVPPVTTNLATLPISQGKVRLDENNSPFVTANFTVPLTSLELLEQIDPRDPQRVTVTAAEAVSGVSRTYNLGLRSRTVDHKNGTIDIEATSDEILLWDRKRVATTADSTPRQHEASLRAVCNWALGKIGAALAPGADDADISAAWDGTNLIPNPVGGVSTLGWVAGGSGGTIAVVAGGRTTNPYRIRVSNAAAGYAAGPFFATTGTGGIPVTGGKSYTTTAWVRSNRAVTVSLAYQWVVSAGSAGNHYGPAVTLAPNVWTPLRTTATVPENVIRMGPYVYLTTGSYPAASWIDIDEVAVFDAFEDLPYFNGDTPDTSLFTYAWEGTPFASKSTRKAAFDRPRELFNWKPGQSLQDFLQPLINAAGLRLFCDENRVWRLVNPEEYEVDGFVVAQSGYNATEGTDEITRNDDTWADAVVVEYSWTGTDGESKTAYDVAGPDTGKTITRKLQREYTGPGAAASLLASFQGRGRTQSVLVAGQYAAAPGMDVAVNLPGTLTQVGKVRATEIDLGSGLSRIETRGLSDALPGSWVLWNPTQTWSQVNNTLKWKDA